MPTMSQILGEKAILSHFDANHDQNFGGKIHFEPFWCQPCAKFCGAAAILSHFDANHEPIGKDVGFFRAPPVPTPLTPTLSSPHSWGRWREILSHGRFKRRLSERDVETICRAILVYCLLHYRGDESIKAFIWDLISPNENGLSIPVPRGRKGKKVKSQNAFEVHKAEWIRKYNPEALFQDESYKKHLKHQCNK
ncbi:chromodomain-helicase-DNA-binding protein 8-like isoform X2 [Meleagris gallopavo]|uniref:chromodomain-helicase-DNA-binding protein 8-like isoform X2 n=1 Tax=Meleagris gallopavo TaxID=9103 RepID=UPI000549D557|nr:chromodomain-helicase-DNA-binding protein 8-like isoform X2 [Meleagris gallopavo]